MNERKLHYLLLVAFSLSNKMIIEQTNREKLMPGQPKILEFLLGHDGCTQKEIAKACILDKSTVTSLITRMLLCGLVRKDSDLPDRRTNCIYLTEEGAAQLLSLFIGCVILAFGISMEVAPNVLLVPGEGIVKALSKVCQKRFGTVKVIFDSSLISISFVLSFLFFHRLNGLGAGTVISALVVGKMVNICNHLPVIHKISAL